MKRKGLIALILVISVLMTVFSATYVPVGAEASANLIQNGDFESVNNIWPNNWNVWTQFAEDVPSYVDSTTKHEGGYSLHVTGRNTQIDQTLTNVNQQGSPIQFGHTYQLSFWVKNDALSAAETIKVGMILTSGYQVWFPAETYFCNMAASDWRKVSVTFVNDANADPFKSAEFWKFVIICDQTAGTGEKSVWIDQIALADVTPVEEPNNNLIQSGDFESANGTLPSSWNAWTQFPEDVAAYVDNTVKYEGNYALHVTGRNTQIDQTFTNTNQTGSPIQFGHTYQLSFRVKNDALSAAEIIKAGMIMSNGQVWFPAETYFCDMAASDWRKVSVTFVNDENADLFKSAVSWKFVIICDQTAGTGEKSVWIDNFELIDVTPTEGGPVVLTAEECGCPVAKVTTAVYDHKVGLGFVNTLTLPVEGKVGDKAITKIGFIVATKSNVDKYGLVLENTANSEIPNCAKKFLTGEYDTIGNGEYDVLFRGIPQAQKSTVICGRLYIVLEDGSVVYNAITETSFADLYNYDPSLFSREIQDWFVEE